MDRGKYHFGIGLVVGIVISGLFFHFFAPRYTTTTSEDIIIKQDRWSGDSWQFVDSQWKEVTDPKRDWNNIDQSLRKALNITVGRDQTGSYLRLLKEKYPNLKSVPDAELLSRIRHVYSQQIMTNMYLNDFIKLQGKGKRTEDRGRKGLEDGKGPEGRGRKGPEDRGRKGQ